MRHNLVAQENDGRSLAPSAAQIMADREGSLPVWVRVPKNGHEFFPVAPGQNFTIGRGKVSFGQSRFGNLEK